ncbi:MAG: LPS export ABC transporter permease LptF [Deltaproteobacteria bacterium]|nr:LPS export ABC transporter permease LptF [Deltaproteobacteria bacterium]MBW1953555.1 LPS export ABC transporter permease LptF [Deltaproteobacteria bacterium]MBW1987715.1 LPS export ABC transporter permease LptF [Deltaproteobacteria bacterium]MBW2135737.1 LPS export ABC transporter permease LptF [Deltaproteobacteria bacterium]
MQKTIGLPRPWIIHRYLWQEYLGPFMVSLLAFTLILFMGRIMRIMQMTIVKGVGLGDILRFCLFIMPFLLVFTVPMAAMVAVLLTFLRLSADHEIMALKTAGVSVTQLLPSVLGFALITTLISLILSLYASPWGNHAMRQLLIEVTKRRADLGIREQVFHTDFPRLMVFVNKVKSRGETLEGIFISDERDPGLPNTIIAETGAFYFDPQSQMLMFQLFHGRVIRVSKDLENLHAVEFESYQIPLELFNFASEGRISGDEMFPGELRQALAQEKPGTTEYNRLVVELGRRFSLPIGGFLLALIAMPLGLSTRSGGRSLGLIIGLVSFVLYYILLTASWRLGVNGSVPPAWAPWVPNFLFCFLAGYLWWRCTRDLSFSFTN